MIQTLKCDSLTKADKYDCGEWDYIWDAMLFVPVNDTVEDILGGVRSACTYIGARRLKDMPKCASFVTTHNVINKVYEQYTK